MAEFRTHGTRNSGTRNSNRTIMAEFRTHGTRNPAPERRAPAIRHPSAGLATQHATIGHAPPQLGSLHARAQNNGWQLRRDLRNVHGGCRMTEAKAHCAARGSRIQADAK